MPTLFHRAWLHAADSAAASAGPQLLPGCIQRVQGIQQGGVVGNASGIPV